MTKKRFIVLISLVGSFAVAAVILLLVLWSGDGEEDATQGLQTVELSSSEVSAAELATSDFLQRASEFGVNLDGFSDETASSQMELLLSGSTESSVRTTRSSLLSSLPVDSSADFSRATNGTTVADEIDKNSTAQFSYGSVEAEAQREGYYRTVRDEEDPELVAKVKFSGNSKLSHFIPVESAASDDPEDIEDHSAESIPWEIRTQEVPIEGEATLVEDSQSGEWLLSDLKITQGEFALPFWKPVSGTRVYPVELAGESVRKVNFPTQS